MENSDFSDEERLRIDPDTRETMGFLGVSEQQVRRVREDAPRNPFTGRKRRVSQDDIESALFLRDLAD